MRGVYTVISVIVAVMAVTIATIAFFPVLDTQAADGRRIEIEIEGFEFQPEMGVVRPGDVVVWVNKDIVPHTATAKDGSWDSGLIETGEQWEMTIEEDMVLAYYCRYHPSMIAGLRIESTSEPESATTPGEGY